jgi:hypothetical protein
MVGALAATAGATLAFFFFSDLPLALARGLVSAPSG